MISKNWLTVHHKCETRFRFVNDGESLMQIDNIFREFE